jgi:hypothetical protein
MRIRPGGPGDIAAVLALGDEAVKWMNARGNTQQWGTAPWTGNDKREAAIGDRARGSGMLLAMRLALPASQTPGYQIRTRLAGSSHSSSVAPTSNAS